MPRIHPHAQWSLLLLALLAGAVWGWSNLGDQRVATQVGERATTERQCRQRLEDSSQRDYPADYRLPVDFTVMSWNIYKANREQLLADLTRMAPRADILLLQEALLDERFTRLKPHWRFAPGYRDGERQTGVMTLSRWPAVVHCELAYLEPWLHTPKATHVAEYLLADGRRLLAINLHAVNFELGLEAYRRQLVSSADLIATHDGPVIFAGDLNSWSDERMQLVRDLLGPMGLAPADFTPDGRSRLFGRALDHVWVRGVRFVDAGSEPVESSDHNPLWVHLSVDPATPGDSEP